jgi:hypothetical protein
MRALTSTYSQKMNGFRPTGGTAVDSELMKGTFLL